MSGTLLEARGLRTGYGRLPVVFNVDLEVKEGEIVALLGANGAGKTTTLRALSGMLPLMAGEVSLDGKSLKRSAPNAIARGGVVHVPQGRGIFPNLRVDETLRLACAMAGIRRAEVDARVADMYAVFERLDERRTQLAGTLSGGEQQMLAIARGLIMKPRLLMIDEMSQGLAPTIVQGLFAIVRSLPEQGVSVLIVEQFVTHALAVASRVYVLEKGEVAFNGKAAELARDEAFVKGSYLGEGGIDAVDVNGAAELRFDNTPELPLHADGLLQTIEDRAAHEGRNATEVLLDLLREAIEIPARQGNGNGGMS
ncbi:MAG TPA: ABC transporter ATP-binding protein [Gaiellaceae bacterium]|jgi:branched-chain amino acid transport system ATP-binding protein|nr:ABC transporter ATP-binding protein [Gaiellaceae bacterium]